jgi:hypothetical protein
MTALCALHPGRNASTTCPRCGNFTCTECNPDGVSQCPTCRALPSARAQVPWERRAELGVASAFWAQLKESTLEPTRFWKTVQPEGSAMDAFIYGWLVTVIAAVGSAPYQAFNFWSQKGQFKNFPPGTFDSPAMKPFLDVIDWLSSHALLAAVLLTVVTVVMFPINFVMHAGLVHLGTMITGLRRYSFATTVRALGYASGPNVLLVIPVVGGLASIYTLVLQVWGLRDLHEGTTGKAIVSVIWYVLLAMCCGFLAAIGLGMAAASRIH